MCSLARAQAVLPINTKAAILKEGWDTEPRKMLLKKTLFPRKKHSFCSWPSYLINVNPFKAKCVCTGVKTDFLEGYLDASRTNLSSACSPKRGEKFAETHFRAAGKVTCVQFFILKTEAPRAALVAQQFSSAFGPGARAWSWRPGIECCVGQPAWSLLLPLPVSLSLCVMNKIKSLKNNKKGPKTNPGG